MLRWETDVDPQGFLVAGFALPNKNIGHMFELSWAGALLGGVLIVVLQIVLAGWTLRREKKQEAEQMRAEDRITEIKEHIDERFDRFSELLSDKIDAISNTPEVAPLKGWHEAP